jgi:hypothetical protein
MTKFLGFGQLTRPDIGLIADGVQNLAEIYKSDQDTALRNVRLNPEILDIIYGLSNTISKEDLRSVSGLSSLLLPTLALEGQTFSSINNSLDDYINSRQPIGADSGVNGSQVRVENVMLYNGSIQCEGASYNTNLLDPDNGLYSGAQKKTTAVSTSRASLFNAEKEDSGYFASATYTGSIRVRRRSHVNRITLNPYTFIPRAPVQENPSHKINCYVGSGSTRSTKSRKLGLLATKNSPLKLPCRMSTGTINFGFQDASSPYFYGYQVQPLVSRDGGIPTVLPLEPKAQVEGSTSHTVSIDVSKVGYQNSYDLYVYLYLNPEKVTSLTFSGMSITEFMTSGGKDIGLVGFNNLESLTLNGTSMQILPVWLKTLGTKLKNLNIANSGDTWIDGPLKWFDYRDSSLSAVNTSLPFYTMVSYLTVPKKGAMINVDGNNWNGKSGTYTPATDNSNLNDDDNLFARYIKNLPRTPGTHFRQFNAMQTLSLGNRVYGKNPRMDDVFPDLRSLSWNGGRYRAPISGTLPKINNNGNPISYSVSQSGASGSIEDIGTSATIGDSTVNGACHISKYRIESISIGGQWYRGSGVSGSIAADSVESEWSTWLTDTKSISVQYSSVAVNLQPTSLWKDLQSCNLYASGGTTFKAGSPALNCPNLGSIDLYATSTTGPMPSLGSPANTNALNFFRIGSGNVISGIPDGSFNYILPIDFATDRGNPGTDHKLAQFHINRANVNGRFRENDFKHCYNLSYMTFYASSGLTGNFPIFPTKRIPATDTKNIYIYASSCRFYDFRTLNLNQSNRYVARDIISIYAPSNNTSGGGCILPDLTGLGGADQLRISTITFNSSLPSVYPASWSGNAQSAGKYILEGDGSSRVSGLTPNRETNGSSDNEDNVYWLSGSGTNYRTKVLVNDYVRASGTTTNLARVVNVDTDKIYIDADIPGSSASVFEFKRDTVDITNWFQSGFRDINRLRMSNCRLSGSININAGFGSIVDGSSSEKALDLSSNNITGYIQGFDKIFAGSNRKITITLSNNNFSVSGIRGMLEELLDIQAQGTFTNVRIDLNNTNLNPITRSHSSYSQDQIFTNRIEAISGQTVSLTRTETVKVFSQVTTVNEDGSETTSTVQTGTKNITVPGKLITGISGVANGYYQTQVNGRQQVVEDALGVKFNSNKRWNINLGFTYSPPSTTPTVTSSAFSNPTTRSASLSVLGYNPSDAIPDATGE